MCSNCGSAARGGDTIVRGTGGITVSGSGTPSDPYIVTVAQISNDLQFTVRDSDTVNLQLTGSGSSADPFVLRADTSSASKLRSLGDVASTPAFVQGMVPTWSGSTAAGNFVGRLPGTRYTTSTTRGSGFYQGEVARDTDTQKRYEWDGTQWLALDVTIPSFALDPSVVQNAGGLTGTTDWNTLTTKSGIYRVQSGVNSSNNSPPGGYGFGTLVVFVSANSVSQQYFEHAGAGTLWTRTKWNASDWGGWRATASSTDVGSLSNSINSLSSSKADVAYVNGQVTPLSATVNNIAQNYLSASSAAGTYLRRSGINVMWSGSGLITGQANQVARQRVSFPGGLFGSKPYVTVTPETSRPDIVQMSVQDIDAGGCTVALYRPDNTATGFTLMATG